MVEKNTVEEMIEVLKAFKDGMYIEGCMIHLSTEYVPAYNPKWDFNNFAYRISQIQPIWLLCQSGTKTPIINEIFKTKEEAMKARNLYLWNCGYILDTVAFKSV